MWRIKIATYVSILLIGFVPQFVLAQTNPEWTIDAFDSVIHVREDGRIDVRENIIVTFSEDRHGIFRNIPVRYRDEFGNRVRIDLAVKSIYQDGAPVVFQLEPNANEQVIRIGEANRVISGTHTYVIDYSVRRALLFFDEFDELYWNVTGTEWEVPIQNASATVRLPNGVEVMQTSCYTGAFGSTETDCGIATNENEAAFVAEDFLTVAVAFPKGVVSEPTLWHRIWYFFQDNGLAFIPAVIIISVVGVWYVYGRDPNMRTVIAEYEPPNGLAAIYTAFMHKGFTTQVDFVAMLIQLAVQGYLRIDVAEGGSKMARNNTLVKLKEPTDLDAIHQDYFRMLFGEKLTIKVSDLKASLPEVKMRALKTAVKQKIVADGMYVKGSFAWKGIGIAAGLLQLYGAVALGVSFGALVGILFGVSGFVTIIFGILMTRRTPQGTEVARKVRGLKLFIHTAERYRVKWQEKEHIFEELLPYAIVFGDARHWAGVFADMEYRQPSWYRTTVPFAGYDAFTTDLVHTVQTVSAYTAPSHSGSSGGGSSGGGFGGGGGGSW